MDNTGEAGSHSPIRLLFAILVMRRAAENCHGEELASPFVLNNAGSC